MRRPLLLPLTLLSVLTAPACSGGGGSDGETDGGTDTGSTDGTGTTTGTGSGSTTTDGGSGLMPCDPLVEGSCDMGVCAGTPASGFYCRATCSSNAESGDPCGSGGQCLAASPLDGDTLACFEFDDCDFLTGEGCNLAAGDSCVVIGQDPLLTACVPSGSKTGGETCVPNGIHECGPGFACLGSDFDETPKNGICTAWCDPQMALAPDCGYCVALSPEIGSCAECGVIENNCPAGEQCQPINEALGGVCSPHGPQGDGEPCNIAGPDNTCQDGFLCLEVADDAFACVEKCDPQNPMCTNEQNQCNDIGLLNPNYPSGELGVCFDVGVMLCMPGQDPNGCQMDQICLAFDAQTGVCADTCDPTTGDAACMGNYTCLPVTDQAEVFIDPFAVGNGACGGACSSDADCIGGTCLLTDGLEVDGVCGTPCTPANPTECTMDQSCVPTPGDPQVGACVENGTACDPTDNLSCLGSGGGGCVALDGMAQNGVCMPACVEQDPNACGGMPTVCQVRTDPAFHAGGCVGQPTACDAATQTGCGPDQTCIVVGGGPLGGTAFICDDAGTVAEGGDCSTLDCAQGLGCIGDVCRAYCDLQNDTCTTGTCTDASATFYLPAGTVGLCL